MRQLAESQIDRSKRVVVKRVITNEWDRAFATEVEKHMGDTNIKNTIAPSMNQFGSIVTGLENLNLDYIKSLEKELYLHEGELSNKKSEFWKNFMVDIPLKGISLNLDNPTDLLSYLMLSSKKNVAHSIEEIKTINTTNNSLLYVLTDEEDQAKNELSKAQNKIESYAIFNSMGPEEIKEVLIYMGRDVYNVSESVIKSRLFKEIESDPDKFIAIVNNPYFQDMVMINKATHYRIIYKKGAASHWFNDVMLGSDIYKTIEYLNNPTNTYLKTTILEKIRDSDNLKDPGFVRASIYKEVKSQVENVLKETHDFTNDEVKQFVNQEPIKNENPTASEVEAADKDTKRPYTKKERRF